MRHAILAGDYAIGLPEAFVDVAARDQKTFEDIVQAVNDLAAVQRLFDRQQRRRFLVFNVDVSRGDLGFMFALGGDQQDRFFAMTNFGLGEKRLVVFNQRHIVFTGDVAVIGDHYARPIVIRIEADRLDPASRDAATNGLAEKHAFESDVVDIAGRAGQLFKSFFS